MLFDLSPYISFDAFTVVALLAIALLATRGERDFWRNQIKKQG